MSATCSACCTSATCRKKNVCTRPICSRRKSCRSCAPPSPRSSPNTRKTTGSGASRYRNGPVQAVCRLRSSWANWHPRGREGLMELKTIQTVRVPVRYYEGGQGQPLVFLHGAGGLDLDQKLLNALAEKYHVYAPLLPGYGDSEECSELR